MPRPPAISYPMLQRVEPLDFPIPLPVALLARPAVFRFDFVPSQGFGEGFERRPGVPQEAQAHVLGGVEIRDVDVYEAYLRVLEGCLRGGGEVRPAGANPDHYVGLPGSTVGGQRSRRPDGAESAGVVVGHRALAGLRLADRDAGLLGEAS